MGWELFSNYKTARDQYQPDYFLYENNKSMSQAIREQITNELGVEPVLINSALVSAQNRQRLYWVGKRDEGNTYSQVPIEQPEDRGILLRDVLDTTTNERGYALTTPVNATAGGKTCVTDPVRIGTIESGTQTKHDSKPFRVYSPDAKSVTLQGEAGGYGAKTGLYATPVMVGTMSNADGKIGNSQSRRIYEVKGGQITIKGKQYPIKLRDGYYIIRKLTVRECKRLQTVPEEYIFPVSDTQAYKMLGNGWTVDVIAHILNHFDGIATEPVEVLSMYDGMSCGHIALDKLGVNVTRYYATEIDKYAIKTTLANYPDTIQLGDAFQVRQPEWSLPI